MKISGLVTEEDALSPILGIVLLCGIILVVGALVAGVVLTMEEDVSKGAPAAGFIVDFDGDADNQIDDYGLLFTTGETNFTADQYEHRLSEEYNREAIGLARIEYTDGPALEPGQLRIDGNRLVDGRNGWDNEWSRHSGAEHIEAGAVFELWMHVEDELRIVWDDGDREALLQRYERPDR